MTTETTTTAAPAANATTTTASAPAAADTSVSTAAAPPVDPAASTTEPAKPEEPAGDKPADLPKDDAKSAETAPEKYEAFKAPEGIVLDATVVTEFEGVAKEFGLSQDKAQAMIDKLAPKIAQQQQAALEHMQVTARTEWETASKADKEFGGDMLPQNLAIAQAAWTAFGTPELTQLLNDSGLGNHPEVIRWAFRVGKATAQDGKVVAGSAPNGAHNDARRLYPNSNHAQ